MPSLYMLVGVPCSGKSTWASKQKFDEDPTVICSSDSYIENYALEQGKTYNQVFKEYVSTAVDHMMDDVQYAVDNGFDIVWDQTSLTKSSRRKKLGMIPSTYSKVAVVFPTPDKSVLEERLASRPGKEIPKKVIDNMISQFEMPAIEEGFDQVVGPNAFDHDHQTSLVLDMIFKYD